MEKLTEERELNLEKLKNSKNELNYSLVNEINRNFDWVNQLYLETSQSVIDLDQDPKFLKKEQIDILRNLFDALGDEPVIEDKPMKKETNQIMNTAGNCEKKIMKNKTGNTRKKCKLGHLVDYEIENSKFLSKNFKQKNNKIYAYLYSIDIYKKKKYFGKANNDDVADFNSLENFSGEKFLKNEKSFGILCPYPLSDYFQFRILKPISMRERRYNIEFINIEYVEKISFSKETFIQLTRFHHNLFSDLYSFKEADFPQHERFLNKDSEERKYIIVPIKRERESAKWILNKKKIDQAADFMNKITIGQSVEGIIKSEFCKIGKSTGITREAAENRITSIIKEKVFYSTYKFQLFDIGEVLYAEENSLTMMKKIAEYHNNRCEMIDIKKRNIEELIHVLKLKYFPNVSEDKFKASTCKDIILRTETEADSITKFRNFPEATNKDENVVAFAYGIPLKTINHYDYTYNNSNNLKNCIHSQKKLKKKYDKDASIHNIFPIGLLNTHYLNKKDYKLATKLPTILAKFERCILPYDMCNKYKINLNLSAINSNKSNKKDFSFTFDKLKIFLSATTAPSAMEDYNFESLETLGDSILKFILSLKLYIENEKDTEGELQKKRTELLKNDKLHEIGMNSKIYKYVVNQPFKLTNWDPPFKRETAQKFEQNVTKKCMADSVEAIIGACFLLEKNVKTCLDFLYRIKIIDNTDHKSINNTKFKTLDEMILLKTVDIKNYNLIGKEDITFAELYYLNENSENTKINYSENDYTPFTHALISLHDDHSPNKINNHNVNLLQNLINYKFNDVSLLITAFTHPSVKNSINSNYQRLEFLGDSVLEIFLMIKLFVLFEHKLFEDSQETTTIKHTNCDSKIGCDVIDIKNFNCHSLTNAKSLLVSNSFLIKLSSMINLQKFIMISDKKKQESISNFYNMENINSMLNKKSNEYETDPNNCLKPKIISDVFESLLGAILIDSNLEACFKFLDSIYSPFIYYTACFLDSVKFSPVSEFTEMSMKLYQVAPKFIRNETENKLINVEIWINEKMFSKGVAMTEERAKEIAAIEGMKKINTRD